jgi:hypothetical protein
MFKVRLCEKEKALRRSTPKGFACKLLFMRKLFVQTISRCSSLTGERVGTATTATNLDEQIEFQHDD